jgi:hypothetical protein
MQEGRNMRLIISEFNEQKQLIQWWRDLKTIKKIPAHYHLICTDTAAARTKGQQAKYKAMGAEPGTPDLFLAVPAANSSGLWIELKKPGREKEKNGGLTPEQLQKLSDIIELGYDAVTCYSAIEAQIMISSYLGMKLI